MSMLVSFAAGLGWQPANVPFLGPPLLSGLHCTAPQKKMRDLDEERKSEPMRLVTVRFQAHVSKYAGEHEQEENE